MEDGLDVLLRDVVLRFHEFEELGELLHGGETVFVGVVGRLPEGLEVGQGDLALGEGGEEEDEDYCQSHRMNV